MLVFPYKYLLQNAWGFTTILNQMVGFGNAIHYCLEIAVNLIKSDGLDPISAIATAIDESFHLPYIRGAEYENARISARRSLIAFARRYGGDLYNVWKVEYEINFPLENSLIRGITDVILKNNDEYEIRDYKTSTSVNPLEEIALQMQLYAIVSSNLGFNVTKGSIAYMQNENNRPTVLEVDVSIQALNQTLDTIKSIIQNIKDKNFTATPETGFCITCDFSRICRWNR